MCGEEELIITVSIVQSCSWVHDDLHFGVIDALQLRLGDIIGNLGYLLRIRYQVVQFTRTKCAQLYLIKFSRPISRTLTVAVSEQYEARGSPYPGDLLASWSRCRTFYNKQLSARGMDGDDAKLRRCGLARRNRLPQRRSWVHVQVRPAPKNDLKVFLENPKSSLIMCSSSWFLYLFPAYPERAGQEGSGQKLVSV